ncbi:MAG: hypothetical protein ABIN48_13255 [Ginsengibacter sp.]
MNPENYINNKLSALADSFPNVKIKYAYNSKIETHIVELTPEREYYFNEKLDDAWIPISREFKMLFEFEDISFISSDSILKIATPEKEWNSEVGILDLEYYNQIIEKLTNTGINIDFPTVFSRGIILPDFFSQKNYTINGIFSFKQGDSQSITTRGHATEFDGDFIDPLHEYSTAA